MPQISKVRIVNFSYNDGKRLIADELYDFANKENNTACNVLINLANGGGKTVLVQLMLQPLVPKAKVADRRIESFFTKGSDHCFVLLEWLKDNSSEKLLTGIAMAASESGAGEDETHRGTAVKYYTFYVNYSDYTTKYDIVNMPLSEKGENGRFIPADFDKVRKLAKSSNGALCYYASDDNPMWQKKLAEYGLVRNEWDMITKLNAEEGGLGKFFGNFGTSDKLVDGLLIPTIEAKLRHHNRSKDDDSLSTMLISYAQQYADRQEVLQEKKVYEDLVRCLRDLEPEAKELWEADHSLEICVRELFAFSDALNAKLSECKALQEKYEAEDAALDSQMQRIEHERLSSLYYEAKATFDAALDAYELAKNKEQLLTEQYAQEYHRQLVLECAGYYQKLCLVNGELEAIQFKIACQENGGEYGHKIAALKYSVYVQVSDLQRKYLPEHDKLQAQLQNVRERAEVCRQQLEESEIERDKAKAAYARADGRLSGAREETDRKVAKSGIDVLRRLDGTYAQSEIAVCKEEFMAAQSGLLATLIGQQEALRLLDAEGSELPQKKADLATEMSAHKQAVKAAGEALAAYYSAESKIRDICNAHSLDFTLRFTDHIKNFLLAEQGANQAKQAESLRKITISEEEISSAKRGSLHIPDAVIQYLNATGVRYTTCEKYLTELVAQGKLANDRCLEILRNYPAAAFGVLMEKEEKAKFFDYGREQWLPAMIPLFTYKQMEQILEVNVAFDGAIAFFSEEYFANTAQYIEHLESTREGLLRQQVLLVTTKKILDKQIEVSKSFTYDKDYSKSQQAVIDREEREVSKLEASIKALDHRKEELATQRAAVSRAMEETQDRLSGNRRVLEAIDEIMERLSEEECLCNDVQQCTIRLDEAERLRHELASNNELLNKQQTELGVRVSECQAKLVELGEVLSRVGSCTEAMMVEGDWKELWQQYITLTKTLSQELSVLQGQKEDKLRQKREYGAELENRMVNFEEYKNVVFSEEQLSRTRENVRALDARKTAANRDSHRTAEAKGRAEGKLDSQRQALAGREPLAQSEVGADFDARRKQIQSEKRKVSTNLAACRQLENKLDSLRGRVKDKTSDYARPEVKQISLEEDINAQFDRINNNRSAAEKVRKMALSQVEHAINAMRMQFRNCPHGTMEAVESIDHTLHSDSAGDRYFTLTEIIQGATQNAERMVAKIEIDIAEFVNSRIDLIRQCVLQGERIYKGLSQMAASSRVRVYEGRSKTQMIRFDIPVAIEPAVAEQSISDEIDKATQELVKLMADGAVDDMIRKRADSLVGSQNLLRKYIGKESINVDGYKIDQNPQNAGYRSWKQTQVNNSGAEKFVVYFAVILSLMNYTRGDIGAIQDKDLRSTLILDNPFGSTSSKHVLVPMFEIAKHFRVQLICVSDINKSAIINCFDTVIQAIVKRRSMSTSEILTHEGNEAIEHGFYRSEQLSL